MGRRKTGNRNRNKNKYTHLHKALPELPPDIIQLIILEHVDIETKTKCKVLNKDFLLLIGDCRPRHIIHQQYLTEVLGELCSSCQYSFFNLSINSKDFRIIISDYDNHHDRDIFFRVFKKGVGSRTLSRGLKKSFAVDNVKSLFKRKTIFKGTDIISKSLFEQIFSNVYAVNLICGKQKPLKFQEWKQVIKQT